MVIYAGLPTENGCDTRSSLTYPSAYTRAEDKNSPNPETAGCAGIDMITDHASCKGMQPQEAVSGTGSLTVFAFYGCIFVRKQSTN